ncbi:hypothetical protein METBIDRAFT_39016 [Metschnikowia bicuspidata var. bicuspidata NRRL YB-4993]|uniref:12 kDa heat shock protein n=1 Tax=Metschnikowia bicuspidata var. bicuspidata NRRL YB-4993 TaxID=869754 RepID=A0A1A0HDB3_9ASCO|nr:hypothetical protein METBIDRAFT_39016 [Metschnikowia bicuspidata var. bicuspidata NRRL YB-4993]OBA21887.1 hypothetical protein METBIDRAFT_39016 [Metschnikowia bicuspidata var. bicuspidata NRRL YB-4993]
MSDTGRKSFTDKAQEAMKPESEKSYLEKAKEGVTNAVDGFAAKNVPDSEKSFGQTVADNAKQGKDDAKDSVDQQGATIGETAQEYVAVAKEQVANAANYVSGVVTGATEGAKQVDSEKK